MKNYLNFDRMLTPVLIQIFFYLTLIGCLFCGLYAMVHQHRYFVGGQILILGPLLSRVICEILIVQFRINHNLESIKQKLNQQ